jgi:hypothetical protein
LFSVGAKPEVGVVVLPTSVVAELSCDASADAAGETAVDVDSVRLTSEPKLNPDGAFPDPKDGAGGAEVAGPNDLFVPPKPKPTPDVPKPELTGWAGVDIVLVGSATDPKANKGGAVPAELAADGAASVFVVDAGCDAKGFVAGAAFALTLGAPNDGKEKGEGFADLLSTGFDCVEDIPGNRVGAEGVPEVVGGNNGFRAKDGSSLVVTVIFDAGKVANGFTVVLGMVEETENETPIPANGFDFGTLSFLSATFSPLGADVEGLVISFACDEVAEESNDGMTPVGGLADGVVVGVAVSAGRVLAFSCAIFASCMRFRASASACCFCQRVDMARLPPAGTGAGDPNEEGGCNEVFWLARIPVRRKKPLSLLNKLCQEKRWLSSRLTFKFVKVPGCGGDSVMVFLLMSRISSLGSEVSDMT